jgi:hypothetical protein
MCENIRVGDVNQLWGMKSEWVVDGIFEYS